MVLENLMYFVLGLLVAALGALVVLPAVWRRAVRLTKKRIEEATPMTMAEFRADKDQLRAEFALNTRRLEMNVDRLRHRLADQLRDVNKSRTEMDGMDGERSRHQQVLNELEERETAKRQRILELEKETASLSQQLRMREREMADKVAQLDSAREALRTKTQRTFLLDGAPLSGHYDADVECLLARIADLSQQLSAAQSRPEAPIPRPADGPAAAAELTAQLSHAEPATPLAEAEAHMADAEGRVAALLAETALDSEEPARQQAPVAERIDAALAMSELQGKVAAIEAEVAERWGESDLDQDALRARMSDVAGGVSRLMNTLDGSGGPPTDTGEEQSLYDRVQKFVGAADEIEPARAGRPQRAANPVSERLAALQQLQQGN